MKKRILATALALVMLLGLLQMQAVAAKEISVVEIVPPIYDSISDFSGGSAITELNGSFGLIDKAGKDVVPYPLDYIAPYSYMPSFSFHDGVAVTQNLNHKWIVFDTTGKELSPPLDYDTVNPFSDGVASAFSTRRGWVIIDKTGKELSPPLEYYNVGSFSDGVALASNAHEDTWIIIDKAGKELSPPLKYSNVRNFSEGLSIVHNENRKYGVIDKTGTEIVPLKYDYIGSFSEGMAKIKQNGKWGFIDKTGAEIIPAKYGEVRDFCEGFATVYSEHRYTAIDKSGREMIPADYNLEASFSEGVAIAVESFSFLSLRVSLFDANGQEIAGFQTTDTHIAAHPFHEGLAAIRIDGKWRYIDKAGNEVIPPLQYDFVGNFSDGLAVVSVVVGNDAQGVHCKCGVIDTAGNEILAPQYSFISDFSDGIAQISPRIGETSSINKYGLLAISRADSSATTAYASIQTVDLDGKAVTFACYALKDANGNPTNFIKLRDLAMLLNGSAAQFQVDWDGGVAITTESAYTPNGSEQKVPFTGDRSYQPAAATTKVNGQVVNLAAIVLHDDTGGGYTYYQLRDLGKALGFNVGWAADKGIFVETDKPYDTNN